MDISDHIWWTRKARIRTETRFLNNAFHSQVILLWYSFCSVAAAIYNLTEKPSNGGSDKILLIFSVLVLCMSGFIQGLGYKERAALVKNCYIKLGKLYSSYSDSSSDTEVIEKKYREVLEDSENHSDSDFRLAVFIEYFSTDKSRRSSLTKQPTIFTCLLVIYEVVIHYVLVLALYILPVLTYVYVR